MLLAIGAAQEGRPRAGGDFGGGGRKPIVCAVMSDEVDPGAGCASCRATAFLLRQLHADHLGIQNVKPARVLARASHTNLETCQVSNFLAGFQV